MSLDIEGWVKFGKLSAEFLVECVKLARSNTYEATVIAFILTMCVAVPLGLILYFSLFGSASPQPSTATTSSSTQQQQTTGSSTSAANSATTNTTPTPTATAAAINTTSNNSSSLSTMKTTAAWLSKQPRFARQLVLGIFIVLLFTLGGLLVMIVFSPSPSSAVEVEISKSGVSSRPATTQELTAMTSGGSPSVVEERRTSSSRSSELSCKWTTYDDNSNSIGNHRGGEGGGKEEEEEEDIQDSDHDSDDGEEDSSSRRMGRRRKGGLRHHRHKEAWNDKFGYFPFMYPPPQSTPPTSSSAHDNDEGLDDDEDDSLAHSLRRSSSTTTVAHSPCRKPRYLYGFSLLTSATPIHVSKKSSVIREMGRSVDNDYFNVLYRSNADQVCRKRSPRGSGSTARHNHRDEKNRVAEEEDDDSIIDDVVVEEEEEEMDDDCFADYTSLYSLNSNGNLNFGWSEFTSNYAGSKRQSKIREGGRRRIFSSSHAVLPRRRRDKYVYLIPIGTCLSSEAAVNVTLVTEKVATLKSTSFPGEDEESTPDPLEMMDEDHEDNELDDDYYRPSSPLHLMNHGGDVLRAARRSQRLEYSSELHGLRFSTLLRQRRENYLLKKHYSKNNQTTSGGGQEEGEDDNTKKKQDRTPSKEVDQDSGNDERNVNEKNSRKRNKRPEVKSDKRRYLVVESMAERLIKRHKAEQRRNRLFEEGGGVQGMEPPPLPVLPEPILFDSVILYRTHHEHERDHHSLMRRSHFNKGHVTQNLNEGRAKEKSSVRTRIGALFDDNEIPQPHHQERRGETGGGSSFSQRGNSVVDDDKELLSLRSSHREISRLQDGARNSALYLAWDTELPPTVGATSPPSGGRSSSKLSKETSKKKIQK